MLDPNERLKRVFTGVIEKLDEHENQHCMAHEELRDEQWQIQETDRAMMNYHYHLGAIEALRKVKSLFKLWGGTGEEWFTTLEAKDK